MKISRSSGLPPVPSVLLSILSVQAGAAIAKRLFPLFGPAGTSGLRIGLAALILLLLFRPPLRRLRAEQWQAVVPYGVALGAMNLLFYLALARIPLGLGVTLEFVGPLLLAVAGSRRGLDFLWVVLAGAGIALIAPWSGAGLDPWGMLLALLAGGCWTAYIVLGKRVSKVMPGSGAVATGMIFAALTVLPFIVLSGPTAPLTFPLLASAVALAALSSALPFTLEMRALQHLSARTFSILMSLEPAMAALCGLLFLHEHLTITQWLAVAMVVAASAGATLMTAPATVVEP
jgi:inner membrane transporter RhtA